MGRRVSLHVLKNGRESLAPGGHRPTIPRLTCLHHSHNTAHTILAHSIADEADEDYENAWTSRRKHFGPCKQFTSWHCITYHKTSRFSNRAARTSNLATYNLAPLQGTSSPVFLNGRTAARYLASIIPGRERFSCNLSFNFLSNFQE